MPKWFSPTVLLAVLLVLGPAGSRTTLGADLDPAVRDRVAAAAVELALPVRATENGSTYLTWLPRGSGTIVSGEGHILTNNHVVDPAEVDADLRRWEEQERQAGRTLALSVERDGVFLVITSDGRSKPEVRWESRVVAQDAALDLAVLAISGDAAGGAVDLALHPAPHIPIGDSATLGLGDPVFIFSYPMIGGGALTFSPGVVSGFLYEDGLAGPAWVNTDATMSGGSSGGTAVDVQGRLVGIPTQGSSLDCRPGDTNRDGRVDSADVGCIPTGGSLGQLRPVSLAMSLLAKFGIGTNSTTVPGTISPTLASGRPDATSAPTRGPSGSAPATATAFAMATSEAASGYCVDSRQYAAGSSVRFREIGWFHQRSHRWAIMQLPAETSPVVQLLRDGAALEITGSWHKPVNRDPNRWGSGCGWWPVNDPSTGASGYVFELYLEPSSNAGGEPTAIAAASADTAFAPDYRVSTDQSVNFRAGPSRTNPILTTLLPRTLLQYLGEGAPATDPTDAPRWMKFRLEDGTVGWLRQVDVQPYRP